MMTHAEYINRKFDEKGHVDLALQDAALIQTFLEKLPDRPHEGPPPKDGEWPEWTCHGLCRAALTLGLALPWRLIDGRYGMEQVNHAWLELTGRYILDVYPVACLTPGPHLYDWHVVRLYVSPRYNAKDLEAFDSEGWLASELAKGTQLLRVGGADNSILIKPE